MTGAFLIFIILSLLSIGGLYYFFFMVRIRVENKPLLERR